MATTNRSGKVAVDMTLMQGIWSSWFLFFTLLVYVVVGAIGIEKADTAQGFLLFAYQPSKIYMLVIGIISVSSFLAFYVKQGVTRKEYFNGAAVAAALISLLLTLLAGLAAFIDHLVSAGDSSYGLLVPGTHWLLSLAVWLLTVLVFYAAGWLIGAGFYRFGLGGLLYIAAATAAVFLVEALSLWGLEQKNPLTLFIDLDRLREIPTGIALLAGCLVLALLLWGVRATIRKVPVKMK